ncbi:MAG: hypothetical protein LUE27_06750 [Clostridia bacterium]|nr:hypothetical protein [Clostridia bacterium]
MECENWYGKSERRCIAGLLLIAGDLLEKRTEECRGDMESCQYKDGCPQWSMFDDINSFLKVIAHSLTEEEKEWLRQRQWERNRMGYRTPKAEPMRTSALYNALDIDAEDFIELGGEE